MAVDVQPLVSEIIQTVHGPSNAVIIDHVRQKLGTLISLDPAAARKMFFQCLRGQGVKSGRMRHVLASGFLRAVRETRSTPQEKVGDILAAFTVVPDTEKWNRWALTAAKDVALKIKDPAEKGRQLSRIAADAELVGCAVY